MQRSKYKGAWCFWKDSQSGHTCLVHISVDGQWYGLKFDLPENANKHPRQMQMQKRVALWKLKHPHLADNWPTIHNIGMEALRCYLNVCAEKAQAYPVGHS